MGKKQVSVKMIYRQNKVHVIYFFFLMENRGIEDPPIQLNGKFHLLIFSFFFTPSLTQLFQVRLKERCQARFLEGQNL